MSYIAKLERGSFHIDFSNTETQRLAPGFVPPVIEMEVSLSSGTSASMYAPATVDGESLSASSVTIPFHAVGDSATQIRSVIDKINSFLRRAGDQNDPTYFYWRPENSVSFDPVWGQLSRKLRVLSGYAVYGDQYGVASLSESAVPNCTLRLTISSIDGQAQQLANALGGVVENRIGSESGAFDGLVVPASTTNIYTNPVFGNATPSTNWSAGTNLTVSYERKENFVLPGGATSAHITRGASTAGQNSFYQSVTAANTNTYSNSAIIKLSDGSTPSSTHIQMIYGVTTKNPKFYNLGDGWWMAYETFTGIASATNAGILIPTYGVDLYLASVQFEERGTPSYHANGDMLGCKWTSTAHASTTTRAAGRVSLPLSAFNPGEMTIEMVWRAGRDSADQGTARLLFEATTTSRLSIASGTGAISYTDATNTASGAATAYSYGDTLIIHVVCSRAGGIKLYRAGAADGAGSASYAPATGQTAWYLGSTAVPDEHAGGYFVALNIYDRAMTAAQVALRYSELSAMATAKDAIGQIPWLWTINGDGVVDDITDATHAAYAVAGGIGGDIPSSSVYYALKRSSAGTGANVMLSTYASNNFIRHDQMYETKTTSTTTSDVTLAEWSLTKEAWRELAGKQVYAFVEIIDAASDQTITAYMSIISGNTMSNTERAILDVSSSVYRPFIFYSLSIPEYMPVDDNLIIDNRALTISIIGKKTSGGATNITVHGELIFENALYTDRETTDTEHRIIGRTAIGHTVTSTIMASCKVEPVIGSIAYLYPGMVNYLFASEFTFYTAPWLSQQIAYVGHTPSYLNA